MDENIIEIRNLSIGYRVSGKDKTIHSNLNLVLRKSELTSILGVNGSGKSTLIKTICGFIPPLSGEVLLNGRNITSYTKEELSSIVSVVLTERVSDGGLTVSEIVSMGRYPYTGFFGKLTANDHMVVEQALRDVGIWQMKEMFISELSDGERQKVMIAKSLAQESKIIILDEPTSFLDLKSRIDIICLLRRLSETKGTTFLLSLHDLELSLQYSDYLWIMTKDGAVHCGQTEELILGGMIDYAAGNGALKFNTETGIFRPTHSGTKTICYEGEDLLWVKNALTREGYRIDKESDLTVRVKDYSTIEIIKNNQSNHCDSISEMIKKLLRLSK